MSVSGSASGSVSGTAALASAAQILLARQQLAYSSLRNQIQAQAAVATQILAPQAQGGQTGAAAPAATDGRGQIVDLSV